MKFNYDRSILYLLCIFSINIAIKFLYIDARDIALDEPFTIFHSQKPAIEIFNYSGTDEINPPFYFLVLHYWIKYFGIDPLSVRFSSVLFSALTAVIIFKICETFLTRRVGILASMIFTLSTLHIFYSHEARTYEFFTLLFTASLYFYLSIISKPIEKSNYYGLFFVNLLVVYSHYYGFFILLVEFLSLLFIALPNKKQVWQRILSIFMLIAALYSPHFMILLTRFTHTQKGDVKIYSSPAVTEYYGYLNQFLNNKYCVLVFIGLTIFSIILLVKSKKLIISIRDIISNRIIKIIFLWFLIPYSLMFAISFKIPMFIDRYILYTSIPFYLFISALLCSLATKHTYQTIGSIIFITAMALTVNLNPDNNRRISEAVGMVKKLKKEQTMIIVSPEYADMSFTYHYNRNYFKDYRNTRNLLASENIYPSNNPDSVNKFLSNHKGDCIYFQAETQFTDPDSIVISNISKKYSHHSKEHFFEIYTVHHFSNY